jgi:hypothetical protein
MDVKLAITARQWIFIALSPRARQWFAGNLYYGDRLSVGPDRGQNVARALLAELLELAPASQHEAGHIERVAATLDPPAVAIAQVL